MLWLSPAGFCELTLLPSLYSEAGKDVPVECGPPFPPVGKRPVPPFFLFKAEPCGGGASESAP